MEQIDQIAIENTLSVQVSCLVNQDIVGKNFKIIMDCLKDLKTEQDSHSDLLKSLSDLKLKFQNSLKNQISTKDQDKSKEASHKQNSKKDQSEKSKQQIQNKINISTMAKNQLNSDKNSNKQLLDNLRKEFQELKRRVGADEQNITENTKDINLVNKQMKDAQRQIEELKKLIKSIKNGSQNQNKAQSNTNGNQANDSKNENSAKGSNHSNADFESIKNLNQESYKTQNMLKDLYVDFQKLNKKTQQLEKQLSDIKNRLNEGQNNSNGSKQENSHNKTSVSQNNYSGNDKNLAQLIKKLENLTKKTDMIQSQANLNTSKISDLTQDQKKLSEQSQQHKQNIDLIHKETHEINKALQQLQNIHNEDVNNIMQQINKLKDQLQNLLKNIGQAKNHNQQHSKDNSNKNYSFQRSGFRKKSQSSQKDDYSGRISELSSRLAYLQKIMSTKTTFDDHNPQKLPIIKKPKKDFNSTGYNEKSSAKKDLSELKHQLQAYIKSYMLNQKGNDSNGQFDLKLQQIKNNLNRKADYQGMKKGLAFLQNKITQLYLFLTEPDTEDAMIVRKGFNCLSCSKKVQKLRGKLGPRMNWDNMTAANYSPPKVGYQKGLNEEKQ